MYESANVSFSSDKSLHKFVKIRFEWLKELINDAIKNSTFQSKLIERYYLKISLPYANKVLKTSIVLLIIFVYISIAYSSYYQRINTYDSIIESLSLIALLLCLSSTLFLKTYKNHIRISIVSVLVVLLPNLLICYTIKSKIEISYSPIIQIVVLVFTFMPINFSTAVCITFPLISFLLLGTAMHLSLIKRFNEDEIFQNDTLMNILSANFISVNHFNVTTYVLGQLFLWLSCYLISYYVYTCNRLWKRSAFLTLRENVQAKKQAKYDMKDQMRWIEAIMPSVVKDEYLLNTFDSKDTKWVYIRPFENVSILFADIVGFTNMSSNKTASQVVTLLNDLFNRFDEFCQITNCEKIGTLGDCYYCVAGCPVPRPDHAVSCVEMGLGMCRIIKQFNRDHNENVNMRVGIHTGRVNAAIIGTQRFRFDVYSNDVIIANTMESSGRPGRVHISEKVLEHIQHIYVVTPGEDLEIKKEEDHGISGMKLKSTFIKTYFVDPTSSHLQKRQGKIGNMNDFQILDINSKITEQSFETEFQSDVEEFYDNKNSNITEHTKSLTSQIIQEVAFIETLRYDPDKKIECFHDPPVNFVTLEFSDPEIEWHYQVHTFDHIQMLLLYSAKFSPLVESIVSLSCTLLIVTAVFIFFYDEPEILKNIFYICSLLGLTISLIIIEFWKATTYYSLLKRRFDKCFYFFLSHQTYHSLLCIYMTILPNTICFLILYDCNKYTNDYYFQSRYFSLTLFSTIISLIFVSNWSWPKAFAVTINFFQCIIFGCFLTCYNPNTLIPTKARYTCLGDIKLNGKYINDKQLTEYLCQYIITFILVLTLIRDRERNLRIWFYVTREGEIGREEALRMRTRSEELLYNIIPKYVFKHINARGDNIKSGKFSYAVSIPKAAVVFACISNFFSKYYREDYKGGGNALRLLHTIINKFDNILLKKEYKDVEKIKTTNDCYMLASGLNTSSTESNACKENHLISLMKYAFAMQRVLITFNEHYIFGMDKFEIKIGYNIGPVTAGIIGSTKPMYDIWGDTVNVSSRMYSTGKPGEIQVPHYVATEMKPYFKFRYRDKIFVKGKGDMDTYLCVKERQNLNPKDLI